MIVTHEERVARHPFNLTEIAVVYLPSRFASRAIAQLRELYSHDSQKAKAAQAVIVSPSPDVLTSVAHSLREHESVTRVVANVRALRVHQSATVAGITVKLPQLAVEWAAPDAAVRKSFERPVVLLWVSTPVVDPNLFSTLMGSIPRALDRGSATMFEGRYTTWWNGTHPPRGVRNAKVWRQTAEEIAAGTGVSTHSSLAFTLPLVIAELERMRVSYVVEATPGVGYLVRRKDA